MGKHCQCSTPAGKLHTSFATGFDAALRVAQHLVMKYAQNALPPANRIVKDRWYMKIRSVSTTLRFY